MSQHFVKLREKYRREIRKKQLEEQFKQSRKNWKVQQMKNQQRQFYKMREQINEDNYSQNVSLILNFCYNDSLNFMLLPLVPYTYDEIMRHSNLQQNLLILQALTQFQEIQIPQTEQFVQILIDSLSTRAKVVLHIISNLLEIHRYQQIFRDLLIDANFMYRCQQILNNCLEEQNQQNKQNKSDLVYLYFSICCKFIRSHPMLDLQLIQQIGRSLVQHIRGDEQKYQLFQTLSSISQTFNPTLQIAQLFYNMLIKIIVSQYIQYQEQITQFFIYCIRSKLFLEPSLQILVVNTLQSHLIGARSKALTILQLQIKRYEQFQRRFIFRQLQQIGLLQKLNNLFVTSQRQIKIQCLECFQLLTRSIVIEKDNYQYVEFLISTASQALNDSCNDLISKALSILLIVLSTIHQQQLKQTSVFALIQKHSIQPKLLSFNFPQKSQLNITLQQILSLMNIQ